MHLIHYILCKHPSLLSVLWAWHFLRLYVMRCDQYLGSDVTSVQSARPQHDDTLTDTGRLDFAKGFDPAGIPGRLPTDFRFPRSALDLMRYRRVCLEAFGYTLPDEIMTSSELERRLEPLYERLRLPAGRWN